MIYDAATAKPTQARIRLREAMLAASWAYQKKNSGTQQSNDGQQASTASAEGDIPPSFNPIIRLEWTAPEKLYYQTAYVRMFPNDPMDTLQRWHLVQLSPQAALLK